MSYRQVVIDDFPGEDLTSASGRSACTLASNVDLGRPGLLRPRPDVATFNSVALGANIQAFLPVRIGGTDYLAVTASDSKLHIYGTTGNLVTSSVADALGPIARMGDPSNEYVYAASTSGAGGRRWDGSSFSDVASLPESDHLEVQPLENRLVSGRLSKVSFSAAGDGTTWSSDDTIELDPGNGEQIHAMAVWQNELYVFKESAFYVFYGNSLDPTGAPIFNYRKVAGRGCVNTGRARAVSTPHGIFFVATDGIYLTTGGAATKISQALQPLIDGETEEYGSLAGGRDPYATLGYADDKLFLTYDEVGGTTRAMHVYWPELNKWARWDSTSFGDGPWQVTEFNRKPTVLLNTGTMVYVTTRGEDPGSESFTAKWRTGHMDLGNPNVKHLREVVLWGSGSSTVAINEDFTSGAASTAVTLTAGTEGRYRTSHRGSHFMVELGGTNSEWEIDRATLHVASERLPGMAA